jgi:two-component system NarL family sensor kinase
MGKQIAHLIEQDLGMMRSLVGDLVPDELEGLEVADAIETVVSRHRHGGLLVHSTVATADEPGPVVTGVVYRVVREALRNVERHAAAQNAWVDLEQVADSYVLTVRDDGRGVSGRDVTQETDAEGHFGLVLLESLVRDVGGTLSLEDHPTYGGSLLTVRIPATTPR